MIRIAIVSGRYPASQFASHINHRVYADKHGYTYIHCNWPTRACNPYFNKLLYIKEYLDYFDYIFWIDDDAFFWDMTKKLEDFLPHGEEFFTACKSPDYKELKTYLSSGQFFLKNSADGKKFLNDVLITDMNKVKQWWTPELGYYSNGDQDSIVYNLILNSQPHKYKLFDYKSFNSRIENLQGTDTHPVFILHFTGKYFIKIKNYNWAQKKFSLGPELVKSDSLKEYFIFESKPTNWINRIWRKRP